MKYYRKKPILFIALAITVLLIITAGCVNNLRPLEPQTPAKPVEDTGNVTVTYNTGKVQLSKNDLVMKVGQKLTLQPAQGLTKNTRFTSSGENFFGDIMQQDTQQSDKAVFTAIKSGKGRLQIIPNTDETDRAVDLWVTVQ